MIATTCRQREGSTRGVGQQSDGESDFILVINVTGNENLIYGWPDVVTLGQEHSSLFTKSMELFHTPFPRI